tara:strand:- start:631040 stop:632524 length:1485 start_codon:yes stop_codon:yes gene_type:complete
MSAAPIPWKHIRNVLVLFAPVWVGATCLFGVAGVGYALFRKDVWAARLPIVVRDEATTAVERLGRFASQTDLKAAQETLLEMTQNPEVVSAALEQIGPPDRRKDEDWPSTRVVDDTIKACVNLVAPKGTEFGNTEVVYLQVKGSSQQRTVDFCRAMFDNLTEHLRKVRRVRADSIISELTHARNLAIQNLDEASARMREIEIQFGADLGELRNLSDAISGDGTNRRALEETTVELQAAELELEKMEELNKVLVAGAQDPQHLLISGGDLLSSQPSLQRLKDGLIDAQLATSQLSGVFTDANPKRRAALATEKEIKSRMQQETAAVIRATEPTIRLQRERVNRLHEKKDRLAKRLEELAEGRSNYAKIDAEVRHRTEALGQAERHLSEAQASRSAALSTNLVAELGPPQVTDNPVGPGGSVLVAGSTMAGLIFGLGVVFLVAPGPTEGHGRRRWSDYLTGHGRRASDTTVLGQMPVAAGPVPMAAGSDVRQTPPA